MHIGETGRNLNTMTEHKQATRKGDANNHIAESERWSLQLPVMLVLSVLTLKIWSLILLTKNPYISLSAGSENFESLIETISRLLFYFCHHKSDLLVLVVL